MGNEQGSGYAVLDLRLSEAEKDIIAIDKKFDRKVDAVNKRLDSHIDKNEDEHKEMRQNIIESNLIVREINIKMAQMVTNSDDMKRSFRESTEEMKTDFKASTSRIEKNLETLGAKSDKESGWRAIIMDILKIIFLLIGFIATGKWFL